MIFIMLGTQDKPFNRILEEIDKLIEKKVIKEKVVAQIGFTSYKSKNFETFDLVDSETFNKYISDSDLIITHGGVGSILSAIKQGKKVIAIPRLQKYGEHTNDHQIQIVNEFAKTGYILKCDNPRDLEKVLKKEKDFVPKKYISNTENMIKLIEDYIDNL